MLEPEGFDPEKWLRDQGVDLEGLKSGKTDGQISVRDHEEARRAQRRRMMANAEFEAIKNNHTRRRIERKERAERS